MTGDHEALWFLRLANAERTAGTDRYFSIVEVYVPPLRFMIIYEVQRISRGFHVIIEGILRADHYGAMLATLISDCAGRAFAYYLDVPFEETLRRHQAKPQASEYGRAEMSSWYRENDLLPGGWEQVITADWSLDQTVQRIMCDTGLARASA